MQQLLQGKYASMQQVVLAELTTNRSVKPVGEVQAMFDYDPQLAAAIKSAWGYVSLTSVVDEARAYWDVREAGAQGPMLAASTVEKESTPNQDGLSAEELLARIESQRGSGR